MNARASLIALVGLAAACGPSQEELDAANARAADLESQLAQARAEGQELQQQLDELATQNGALAARLTALGENVEDLQGQNSRLSGQNARLQQALEELRERERQARTRLDTFRNLIERFRSMIESGQLRVRIVRNRMVVELPEGILFDSGRAGLKERGQETLAEVAGVLAQIENRSFQIAGHTDNVPIRNRRFRNNWELSTRRAVTVTRYLISQGVPANRVSAAGYADTEPTASNDTPEGRAQNRRIEIVLLPNLDELPDLSSLASEDRPQEGDESNDGE